MRKLPPVRAAAWVGQVSRIGYVILWFATAFNFFLCVLAHYVSRPNFFPVAGIASAVLEGTGLILALSFGKLARVKSLHMVCFPLAIWMELVWIWPVFAMGTAPDIK